MKKVIILGAALLLAGCQTDSITTVDRYTVVTPPDYLYQCPDVKHWPDPQTLTDLQVAQLLTDLTKVHEICKNSLKAIRKYEDAAKARIEQPNQSQPRR